VTVGIISDTHGLLRKEALDALQGSDLIIHAGDVGSPAVLERLSAVAQVRAVRGNVDTGVWACALPEAEIVDSGGVLLYVLHDVHTLDLDPAAEGFQAVISGHSHKPQQQRRDNVLFLNPGSAGPRRFNLPITLVRLYIRGGTLEPEFVDLTAPAH